MHQFKIAGVSREQFKIQNSKFKIAAGNNSKLKTQNSKLWNTQLSIPATQPG